MFDHTPDHAPLDLRQWFANLSPVQQLGYGCLGILIVGTLVLYCGGALSLAARSALPQRAPTPTVVGVRATTAPLPTQPPPTFINLPPGTLLPTPTQAPIPTREPTATPTLTPTVDLTNPAPFRTITPTVTSTWRGALSPAAPTSAAPTRRATPTLTVRP